MIKIDKGVPIPDKNTRQSIFPFNKLAVNESFFVPEGMMLSARSIAYRKGGDKKFVTRREGTGLRIWRIR